MDTILTLFEFIWIKRDLFMIILLVDSLFYLRLTFLCFIIFILILQKGFDTFSTLIDKIRMFIQKLIQLYLLNEFQN